MSNDTFEFKSKTDSFAWLYHNYISNNKSKPKLYMKSKMTPFQVKEQQAKKLNENIQKKLEKNRVNIDSIYLTNSSSKSNKNDTLNLKSFHSEKIENVQSENQITKKKILNIKKYYNTSRVLTPLYENKCNLNRISDQIQKGMGQRTTKGLISRVNNNKSNENFNPSSCFKVLSRHSLTASYIQK
jgi:hypothetical protein